VGRAGEVMKLRGLYSQTRATGFASAMSVGDGRFYTAATARADAAAAAPVGGNEID